MLRLRLNMAQVRQGLWLHLEPFGDYTVKYNKATKCHKSHLDEF